MGELLEGNGSVEGRKKKEEKRRQLWKEEKREVSDNEGEEKMRGRRVLCSYNSNIY